MSDEAARPRFSLGLPTAFPLGGEPNLDFLDFAERAEELGYDGLWAGDHVVFHIPRMDVMIALTAVAMRTRRVAIGPGVLLLCLRNPVHVALAVATLDRLSGGRLRFGVGVGGEHRKEFDASGVPPSERGARTDEALAALRTLWSAARTSFAGRFYRFEDLPLTLAPLQKPHPPFWIGGRSPAALRRTAEHGAAWFPGFLTVDGFRERSVRLDELCAARGRDPKSVTRAFYAFVSVDADPARAREQAETFLSRNYAMPYRPFEPYAVTGTPAECAARLRAYLDAGVEDLTVRFATGEPLRQLDLWTREVMPRLRDPSPSRPAT